jgi:hypothetical protein
MEIFDRKKHWENIYQTKELKEVSWFQPTPETSLNLEILNYLKTAQQNLNPRGIFVIGTFSEQGPKKCSDIEIKQYSETTMTERLKMFFEKINCITVDHKTPFGTLQNFVFCGFRKLEIP